MHHPLCRLDRIARDPDVPGIAELQRAARDPTNDPRGGHAYGTAAVPI
jgi:hypothetical protein